jgi:dCMP deaminase
VSAQERHLERLSWDETWMRVAFTISRRSVCSRGQNGAVIVDPDNRIIATGYNGYPAGFEVPDETCKGVCPRADNPTPGPTYQDCVSIHAEANALLFCDRRDREDGTIYVTTVPCWDCAKMIANSGLRRVVCTLDPAYDYRLPTRSLGMLRVCDIEVVEWPA